MNSLGRIAAIIRTDFLIRFRRVSTIVVFLLLSAFAYLWIPAPSSGRALIVINGRRAIYNSGAIGMGTASLAMIFVGLFGYYVISNAIQRDITSRCGFVIASTSMRTLEYLVGKFCGNLAFLVTFTAGFMLSSMAMLLVRGEAPLEPLVFVRQYLLLTPAAIVLVSAVAVFFESTRLLAGRLGDVVYFFLFVTLIGVIVGNETHANKFVWTRCVDFTGFGFMIHQMQSTLHTESVSIGASDFNAANPTILFPGLTMTRDWIAPRLISLVLPLALLPIAALTFHRFDPVRIGRATGKSHRTWLDKLQSLAKPLTRRAVATFMLPARGRFFLGAMWIDAALTLTLSPFAFIALVAISLATIFAPLPTALPIAFALLGILIADIPTRDLFAGTISNLYALPRLRENFTFWKLGSTVLFSFLFCFVPLIKTAALAPARLAILVVGLVFSAAAATLLGVVSSNAKTFIVAFLTFWYLAVNDHGASPNLDFAGFNGSATNRTLILYALLASFCALTAHVVHRVRLSRS